MPSIQAVLNTMVVTLGLANAHMKLFAPAPYGNPDTSPLAASGADFPCKSSNNAGASVTTMQIGSEQTLSFNGSAVHGGGSCQIALTKDTPATKSSKWQVIHSIEGGCPARGQAGNLPESTTDSDTYKYTIPNGIDAGAYTFAWTWFNKIGNREMYMNCASIKVTAGSSKRGEDGDHANDTIAIPTLDERDTTFPDLFVANIPPTACTTAETVDLQFPNPGSSVEKAGSGALGAPTGPQCSAGPAAAGGAGGGSASSSGGQGGSTGGASGASGSSGSGSSGSGSSGSGSSEGSGAGAGSGASGASSAPSPSASSSGSASVASNASGSGNAGGVASGAASSAASSPTGSAPFANTSSATPPAAASGATTSSSNAAAVAAPASAGTSSSSCTAAGQVVCSPDGKQIAECGSDLKVTWIPTAAGTVCKNGMMVAAKPKLARSAKFLRDWILHAGDRA